MNDNFRIEYDSMGSVEIPSSALYGPQTQRALNNFTISDKKMPETFIQALLIIKKAAALANRQLDLLTTREADAIIRSIEAIHPANLSDYFPVPILQTGSGTSTNMNVNEVIANLAAQQGIVLSPNDHVNMGQSSNDVIPSALHLSAALQISSLIIPALSKLAQIISSKGEQYTDVVKTGRTHLMDALPIRLVHELNAWASQINDNMSRLQQVMVRLSKLPLGGTAVGSGVNCPPGFAELALQEISVLSGLEFQQTDSTFKGISCIDTVLETSGHLKGCGVTLLKIANDLRWMNSGPEAGLAEVRLEPLQPGSSIMVDKVNPVIPEAVCMAAARVIGNDTSITIAAQSGNFQLNTMLPLAASDLLESGELIGNSCSVLAEKAIQTMTIRENRIKKPLDKNPVLVTALTPYIGYLEAARLAKKAREEKRSIREIAGEETDLDPELLDRLLDPLHLANGGAT